MYQTTREWITSRAKASGLDVDKLCLDPDVTFWEIFISYNGSPDETLVLGDTMYVVNIADWLTEQCSYESAVEGGGIEWTIEVYPDARFDGAEPLYRKTDMDVPAMTCCWNAGGDPGAGCDGLVSGPDLLCATHERAARALPAARCEARTARGMCDRPLTARGVCLSARAHVDV